MSEGDWSGYVSDAGTDPSALDSVAQDMTGAASNVATATDSLDLASLPESVVGVISDVVDDVTSAASWADFAGGDLSDASSWDAAAAEHVQAAEEWAASGNFDAAQQELDLAATASDLADSAVDQASTDLSIGAESMDASADLLTTTDVDTSSYDTSSYDTSSYSSDVSVDVSSDS